MNKQEIGTFLLRVMLGISFFLHGLSKFKGGLDNTSGWFQSIGIPGFMAYVVGIIELVGGIALIIGLGTRIISALLVFIMAGAIVYVKFPAGFMGNGEGTGYELDLVLMIIALHLVLNGSRFLSIDSKLPNLKKRQDSEMIAS
ncbi:MULTISPECIES: DoxX family protein [Peribacillus]|uniref:Oxidoreductase n=2 Tax=Peribacillus simplex TaxID=1478 RepID=A0A223ENX4_9BACI|nr:DoxX family protein [Peribacillus simplex]ASS96929.1 oxidoreductase [Peribacillus simplex NBRC 15720 = DSM 1321]MEC1398735.1 DoxX family protein [Peribacillus simplex]MED3912144.1 DoxX family protein [Peribacillus simplex]MED3986465.1 DoxX family protein [Peribacillus simplex]MED4096543.1 DoxX family protein [Peribacillus simplex]